jgi:hypothetical protein
MSQDLHDLAGGPDLVQSRVQDGHRPPDHLVGVHPVRIAGRFAEGIARSFFVPVVDYDRPGEGLLIAVGAGMMLATMDLIPSLRWCLDVGGGASFVANRGLLCERNRLLEYLAWMDRVASHVVVAAWFSVTSPADLARALSAVDPARLFVYSNRDLGAGRRCDSLGGLADDVRRHLGDQAPPSDDRPSASMIR